MGLCNINVYFLRIYYQDIYKKEKNLNKYKEMTSLAISIFYTYYGDRNESLFRSSLFH